MKTYIFLLITAVLISGCTTPTTTAQLQELMQTYHEETLKMNPIGATYQGDTRYNDYLPNYLSDDVIRKHKTFYKYILQELNSIADNSLSEEDELSKEILKWECETNLMGMKFPKELLPIDQMWTLQLTIGQLATGTGAQPFKTVEDYENWLSRVDDYVVWLSSAKMRMAEGIEQGVVLSKSLIRKVVPQLESITEADLEKNIFYTPARNFPEDFTEEQKEKLSKAYADMVTNKIIPSYQRLVAFMASDYLAAGRNSSGFDAYSFGEDYYNYAIRLYTTTDMTADEIH